MESIKTKSYLQSKKENKAKKDVILIGVIAFIGAIAPFLHIFYASSDAEGIFGFKEMSSFLFAIGFPVLAVCYGFILNFISYKLEELRATFQLISIVVMSIGFYFISWAIIPSVQDYPPLMYYGFMILIAIACSLFMINLHNLLPSSDHLKLVVRYLTTVIEFEGKEHAKDKDAYERNVSKPIKDYVDEQTK
ncbi:hypothetical protein [Zhouia amylolytica]|uniref:hypothetical protein n=1 Tax=Zhouia amylolytica TaxID=376730 RepID=UPI00128EB4B8|nr:hypothetical protein [Zhouia amylolytica]MCQ0112073.1 hypothetical protein [Zhouia amylolytica]